MIGSNKANKRKPCVFCDIIEHKRQSHDIVFEDSTAVVFRDRQPASKVHLLSCPVQHIRNAKQLGKSDAGLVRHLLQAGLHALTLVGAEAGCDADDVRCGFHWPPYNSVHHLHMHIITPASGIRWSKFQLGTRQFRTAQETIDYLQSLPD